MKWIVVAILFLGDVPVDSKVFARDGATADDCEAGKKQLIADHAARGLDLWAECVEVKHTPTMPREPQVVPAPRRALPGEKNT